MLGPPCGPLLHSCMERVGEVGMCVCERERIHIIGMQFKKQK